MNARFDVVSPASFVFVAGNASRQAIPHPIVDEGPEEQAEAELDRRIEAAWLDDGNPNVRDDE